MPNLKLGPRLIPKTSLGFTLVEMAVVLIIVTVLMGGLAVGLGSQYDARAQAQTQQTLVDIREAMLGFAAAKGRLPCPAAAPTTGGSELPDGGSTLGTTACTNVLNGYVPGTTLGLTPVDKYGYVLDGWNQPIRYAVTRANTGSNANAFTSVSGMKTVTLSNLSPDIYVCASSSGITTTGCGTAVTVASKVAAVIYSIGKKGAGSGADEVQNRSGNVVFVSHDPSDPNGSNEFDDIVTWISPYTLYSRMISAGQLP